MFFNNDGNDTNHVKTKENKMDDVKKSEVQAAVKAGAVEGKMTCPTAREIAEKCDVPYSVVGKTCNELEIKIKGCSLGCF